MSFLLAAILLQENWSTWQAERPAGEEERKRAEARLKEWIGGRGAPELTALAAQVRVVEAIERPLWHFAAETMTESRSVTTVTLPQGEGPGVPPRTVKEVDLASVARPPYDGWEGSHWTIPVAGTAEVVDCADCDAGKKTCASCQGSRKTGCTTCRSSGKVDCGRCSSGRVSCSSCGGDGRRGTGKSRRSCGSCGGSGRRTCDSCRGQGNVGCRDCSGNRQVNCRACGATGKVACRSCDAKGRLVNSLSVYISASVSRASASFTRLAGDWNVAGTGASEAVAADDLDARTAAIPDPALREAILAHSKRERAESGKGFLRQRMLIARFPALHLRYAVGDRDYEAVLTEDAVLAKVSPVTECAAKLAKAAGALANEGRFDEALADAATALRLDANCTAAQDVVVFVEGRRIEERAAREEAEHRKAMAEEERQRVLVMFCVGAAFVLIVGGAGAFWVIRRLAGDAVVRRPA